jgi:UDP-GlcNAc3NAcA epimerase
LKKPTIVSIVGARPQFIKHAPVQLALEKKFKALTIHTGQHYDENMSQVFFNDLGLSKPEYLFDQRENTFQGAQTGKMLTEIESVLIKESPDFLLVYGDTNSTLAGALAASKLLIPVIHIEAGLRSFNREMPEEVNRVVTDHLSEILFCPSDLAVENLLKEGINPSKIVRSGDVMCDMLKMAEPKLQPLVSGKYYFATIHRPYNTDDSTRLTSIFESLSKLEHQVYLAIHPRTKARMQAFGIDLGDFKNLILLEPQGYMESLSLQKFSEGVITDSGGIQKEAYLLGKKCVTIRKETEWIETLKEGWNHLVFDNLERIPELFQKSPGLHDPDLYGDGHAATKITNQIFNYFLNIN